MSAVGAPDPGLLADAMRPLVGARGAVTGAAGPRVLPTPRVHILSAAKQSAYYCDQFGSGRFIRGRMNRCDRDAPGGGSSGASLLTKGRQAFEQSSALPIQRPQALLRLRDQAIQVSGCVPVIASSAIHLAMPFPGRSTGTAATRCSRPPRGVRYLQRLRHTPPRAGRCGNVSRTRASQPDRSRRRSRS